MKLFVVMAHWDPEGRVAPHVRRHITALNAIADRLVVVSTSDLRSEDEAWLEAHSILRRRPNFGYDFFSYRTGIVESDLESYTHVLMTNDTFVGPLVDYRTIFERMDEQPVDFWGLTRANVYSPHLQSFFVCFRSWVVASKAFRQFWLSMAPVSDRWTVIQRYEIGLTRSLHEAGFAWGSYFVEDPRDVRIARRRMKWRARLKAKSVPRTRRREVYQRHLEEAWNPSAALADRALTDARLPVVKIDTLRYDPYRLGADRLLAAAERAHPEHFDGVSDYIERTARFYPLRPGDKLPEPGPLRAVYPLVRYK